MAIYRTAFQRAGDVMQKLYLLLNEHAFAGVAGYTRAQLLPR